MASDPRRALGSRGEQLAAEHLVRLGYEILERNFRTRWGELDIVARDGADARVLRGQGPADASADGRSPLESVHPRKRAQVRRMARSWLARAGASGRYCAAAPLRRDRGERSTAQADWRASSTSRGRSECSVRPR